jgi:hypothetical protein
MDSPPKSAPDSPEALLVRAVELCRRDEWGKALPLLKQVQESGRSGLPPLFYSYLGHAIARVERRVEDGLQLCQQAVKMEFYQPEHFLNLARTQVLAEDRAAAVRALQKGLKLDPKNRGLLALQRELGVRQALVLPFLSRGNIFNHFLGRVRHLLARKPAAPGGKDAKAGAGRVKAPSPGAASAAAGRGKASGPPGGAK